MTFIFLLIYHSHRHMLTQNVIKNKIFDLPDSLLVTLRGSFKIKNFKMRKKRFIHHDSASSTTTGIQRSSITTLERIINRNNFHEFLIKNIRIPRSDNELAWKCSTDLVWIWKKKHFRNASMIRPIKIKFANDILTR